MDDCVWIHYARARPHWYELPEAERALLRRAWNEIASRSRAGGGQQLGCWHVRGQSDFSTVEIWRFATVDDAFDHWTRLAAAGYSQWFAFGNSVGMPTDLEL